MNLCELLRRADATQYGHGRVRYVLTSGDPLSLPSAGFGLEASTAHLVLWQGTVAAERASFDRLWQDCVQHQYVLLISVFGGDTEDNVKVRLQYSLTV